MNSKGKKSLINAEESAFFLVVSLANPSLLQEKEKDKPMKDTSGPKCSESFAKLNQDGCWEKTSGGFSQLTLDGRLEEYSQTWPKAGIVLDGYAMELVMSVRRIKEKGSLLWRTPRSCEAEGGLINNAQFDGNSWYRENKQGVRWGIKLKDAVAGAEKMWPTPTEQCSRGASAKGRQGGPNLQTAVMWPTPTTQEVEHPAAELTKTGRRKSRNGKSSHSLGLADSIKMWPTQKGQLSAAWVECLMNFPLGWTEV